MRGWTVSDRSVHNGVAYATACHTWYDLMQSIYKRWAWAFQSKGKVGRAKVRIEKCSNGVVISHVTHLG
jgi:hypothetical protein